MKKSFLSSNTNVFFALLGLSFSFWACDSASKSGSAGAASVAAGQVIAYVNVDSLLLEYTYYTDLKTDFESKANKLRVQLEQRKQAFQTEYMNAQKREQAGLLSNNDRAKITEDLAKKQDELMRYEQEATSGLAAEEMKLKEDLYKEITSFVKEYNKNKGYKIILGITEGSGILYADESLNITKEVLKGLNEKYKTNKPTKTEEKPN